MSLYLCLTLPKYWLLLLLWNETGLWLFLRVVVVISRTMKKHYQIISVVCLYFVLPRISAEVLFTWKLHMQQTVQNYRKPFRDQKRKHICNCATIWFHEITSKNHDYQTPKKMQTSFSPYTTILSLLTMILLLFLFQNEMCPAQWIPQAVTATPQACGFYGMVRATLAG